MTQPNFTLADGERLASDNPGRFEIPSRVSRETLQIGDLCKLMFEVPGQIGERMWVVVTEADGSGNYAGEVNNVPLGDGLPGLGTTVHFNARHIIALDSAIPFGEA